MKKSDLYNYVIFQDNTQLAFEALKVWMNQPEFLILMFQVAMDWQDLDKSKDQLVSSFFPSLISPAFFYNVSN
ncbi:MAG: hypothetical protein ACW981_21720 [Candidatus Hodarchaeales archaeon]|jgi:hypothetical protein